MYATDASSLGIIPVPNDEEYSKTEIHHCGTIFEIMIALSHRAYPNNTPEVVKLYMDWIDCNEKFLETLHPTYMNVEENHFFVISEMEVEPTYVKLEKPSHIYPQYLFVGKKRSHLFSNQLVLVTLRTKVQTPLVVIVGQVTRDFFFQNIVM